jgi:hypothetical protein
VKFLAKRGESGGRLANLFPDDNFCYFVNGQPGLTLPSRQTGD